MCFPHGSMLSTIVVTMVVMVCGGGYHGDNCIGCCSGNSSGCHGDNCSGYHGDNSNSCNDDGCGYGD